MLDGMMINAITNNNVDGLYLLPKAFLTRGLIPNPDVPIQYIDNPAFSKEAYANDDWEHYDDYLGAYYYDDNDSKITEWIIDPAIMIEGDIETPLIYMEFRNGYQPRLFNRAPYLAGKVINFKV